MKALLIGAVVAATVALWPSIPHPIAAQEEAPEPTLPPAFELPFVRVIDGDTVEFWYGASTWGVGYAGVEAPQGNTPCGEMAAGRQWELTGGGVKFEASPGDRFDARDRLMYHVYTPTGESIELMLVQEGLARASRRQNKLKVELIRAEQEARRTKTGCVWGGPPATPQQPASDFQSPLVMPAAVAAVAPPGFEDLLVAGGFTEATTFEMVPDGRIFVAEKSGIVKVIKNGAVLGTPLINIESKVNDHWDDGLIGMTIDPDFLANGYLYLLYTYENDPNEYYGRKTARVSRFTVTGDVASLPSQVNIVGTVVGQSCNNFPAGADCIPSDSPSHSIGTARFGNDGKLWITMGDGAHFNYVDDDATRSQNLDLLSGKLLRVNADGTAPTDNPFYNGDPTANRSKVYALGLRNPFRFNFNPSTGRPYIGDVGWGSTEEINVARPGANFGWPCHEGTPQQSGYSAYAVCQAFYAQGASAHTRPLIEWGHQGGSSAAVGGAFTGSYGGAYLGAYFYGDYGTNLIRYVKVNANDAIVSGPTDFYDTNNSPVSIQRGLNGDIYYLSIADGQVRRLRQTAGNRQPIAEASATPTNGLTPLTVNFSSDGSSDPDDDPLTFAWNFGDGTTGTGPSPSHTYTTNGVRTATLTVTDGRGGSATDTVVITVGQRGPTMTITSPADGSTYKVGDTITLQGHGTDPEDGPTPAGSLTWTVIIHHGSHTHPFISYTGSTTSFVVPDHGDNSSFEIRLRGVDSGGLDGLASVDITPQPVQLTLATEPPGLNVSYDGIVHVAPTTITTIANSTHTIGIPSLPLEMDFVAWSDGGAQQHNVTVGTAPATVTALLTRTITFDDILTANTQLNGTYPANGVNWGTGKWYVSYPWGAFTTNSFSYNGPGVTSNTFSYQTPRRLTSFQAFNGGGGASTITASCAGNPTKTQSVPAGQVATITTGWTAACTTVTLGSSNGWDTNFDTLIDEPSVAQDTSPPTITGVAHSSVTTNSANIAWTTSEGATTQVEYGTSPSYGSFAPSSPDANLVTAHSQPLTGLQPSTQYYYRVLSRDAAGNLATSPGFTFTTVTPDSTPPNITLVTATNITQNSATVTWTTNEGATSQVEYGTVPTYGSFAPAAPNPSLETAHSQALNGLAPSTQYFYRVHSRDAAGNPAVSGQFTFTTSAAPPDTTPPVISGIQATGITQTGATIGWTTDEASNTQVEYGTSIGYGAFAPASPNPALVTAHSQALSGLTPDTEYHYRVRSRDAANNEAVSADQTFRTAAPPPATQTIIFDDATGQNRVLSGQYPTNVINWGTTQWYLSAPWGLFTTKSVGFNGPGTTSQPFTLITPQRVVSIQAYNGGGAASTVSLACSGNTTKTQSVPAGQVATITTNWTALCSSVTVGSSNGWDTNFDNIVISATADTAPPTFSAVQSSSVTSTSATITWTTNEPSNSRVEYGVPATWGQTTSTDPAMVTSHSMNLTGLTPNTTYNYRVHSVDAATNAGVSGNFTFTTAAGDTTPPAITLVQSSLVTHNSARITWTTNEPSNSRVQYGGTPPNYTQTTATDPALVTSHSMDLTGLTASTTYNYRVHSVDAATNAAVSGNFTFTTAASPPATQTITFDDTTGQNRVLSGQYPTGLIDWGASSWYLSAPWGAFTTKSIGFNGGGLTSASFTFLSPRRIVSIRAFNGGGATTVTIACAGQPTKTQAIAAGATVTITTGFTGTCTTVTITSTNGWDTNFDDLIIAAS